MSTSFIIVTLISVIIAFSMGIGALVSTAIDNIIADKK